MSAAASFKNNSPSTTFNSRQSTDHAREESEQTPTISVSANNLKLFGTVTQQDISDAYHWMGDATLKQLGTYRAHRILDSNKGKMEDIRILVHTKGFICFLPPAFWGNLDYQVIECGMLKFPREDKNICWIAEKNFAYIKVELDYDIVKQDPKTARFASEDPEVVMDAIEKFLWINLVKNLQATPDNKWNTAKSFKENDFRPRTFRFRLGGRFQINWDIDSEGNNYPYSSSQSAAKPIVKQLDLETASHNSLYQEGVNYFKQKNYKYAIIYIEKSIEGYKKNNGPTSKEVGTCYSTLASCYRDHPEKDRLSIGIAIDYSRNAMAIFKACHEEESYKLAEKKYYQCLELKLKTELGFFSPDKQ